MEAFGWLVPPSVFKTDVVRISGPGGFDSRPPPPPGTRPGARMTGSPGEPRVRTREDGPGPGADPRRGTPATGTVLADPALAEPLRRLGRAAVKDAIHAAQQAVRSGELMPERLVETVVSALAEHASGGRTVLNATGVVVHTNLGRAPLSDAAIRAVVDAAGYTDVEFDLGTGRRAPRGRSALAALAAAVPDAAAVHVVNNGAAALVLAATALASGREILVSRGEMVEIGDGFRLPELIASTGARVREVGTTNRTHLRDYADAVGPDTGFVLKVHPSNFVVSGFTAAVDVGSLATLGCPVVVDIGSGLLSPEPLLPDEPDAASMVRAGATLVTASGDKLLGGPQAGLLFGHADVIAALRAHPLARALRVDKLTLAALEATLRGPRPPVTAALHTRAGELAQRSRDLAGALEAAGVPAHVVEAQGRVGGGGAPGVALASFAVALPHELAGPLRIGEPAVVGRVEKGRLLLDLRCVPADRDPDVIAAVVRAHTEA